MVFSRPAAVVVTCLAAACAKDVTRDDAIATLGADEREALRATLAEAGIEPSSVRVVHDLYDVPWRNAESLAHRRGRRDVIERLRKRADDLRDVVAIEDGHVVALRLGGTKLASLATASRLHALVVLDLHDGQVQTLDGIAGLPALDHLSLTNNQLEAVIGIEAARQLHSVYLGGNRLTRLDGLVALPDLEVLNLAGNRFERMPDFGDLQRLRVLSLERNPISKIEGLDRNAHLHDLNLAWCNLTRIENVRGLAELRALDLWHNAIDDLGELPSLRSLRFLGMGENPLIEGDPRAKRALDAWGRDRDGRSAVFTW